MLRRKCGSEQDPACVDLTHVLDGRRKGLLPGESVGTIASDSVETGFSGSLGYNPPPLLLVRDFGVNGLGKDFTQSP
jgi:hypothetical protein